MAADIPQFKLNNGVLMPSVGMGCWMGSREDAPHAYDVTLKALQVGYRHFDTADAYRSEEALGRAIRDSGVPRKDVFVTTKLNNSDHGRVEDAFEDALAALGLEYIDLYLMHWPQASTGRNFDGRILAPDESPTFHETWAAMVTLLATGKVRALGVSNFGPPLLEALLARTDVVPAVNQVELHPFFPRVALRQFCAAHGIILTAYSPFGQPAPGSVSPLLSDETVTSVAKKVGATEGQLVLSWAVQHAISVVPKSENPERMKKNITLVKLDDADMKAIDAIHEQPGKHRSLMPFPFHLEDGTTLGWTYEQLGWELKKGGIAI